MADPSFLFRMLAKYQKDDKTNQSPEKYGRDEKTPAKLVAENFDVIFYKNSDNYDEILKTTRQITLHPQHKQEDISSFIQGLVLATPYNTLNFLEYIRNAAESKYTNLSLAINTWLEQELKQNHPELFNKLSNLDYFRKTANFEIKNSKNPFEVQSAIRQTNSCITNCNIDFFKDMTSDPGTIYIISTPRKKEHTQIPSNAGFIILNAYQGEDKKETLLSVDTIWINNHNKNMLCKLIESLSELASHLNLPIIDKTMSNNYLHQKSHLLDIYIQKQDIFKLGHTPIMTRYNHPWISKNNDGFYIINSLKDKCN